MKLPPFSKGIVLLRIRVDRIGAVVATEIVRSNAEGANDQIQNQVARWRFAPSPELPSHVLGIEFLQPFAAIGSSEPITGGTRYR